MAYEYSTHKCIHTYIHTYIDVYTYICLLYTSGGDFNMGHKHGKGIEITVYGDEYNGDWMRGLKTGLYMSMCVLYVCMHICLYVCTRFVCI
jgi:hypothetical protein